MLSINFSELIWTIINFFLLLFLLKHFLFDPVSRFMDARQARIDAGLDAEREAKEALAANERDMAEQKAQTRHAAADIVNRAAAEDAKRASEAYVKARGEAAALQETGEAELKDRHARESEELKAGEPELAALLAAHLLGEGE